MGTIGKILLGFFVGFLCGLIPLVYGIISKYKLVSFIGLGAAAVTGALFSFIDKSPFTAMIMALIFVIFIYSMNKKNAEHNEDDGYK